MFFTRKESPNVSRRSSGHPMGDRLKGFLQIYQYDPLRILREGAHVRLLKFFTDEAWAELDPSSKESFLLRLRRVKTQSIQNQGQADIIRGVINVLRNAKAETVEMVKLIEELHQQFVDCARSSPRPVGTPISSLIKEGRLKPARSRTKNAGSAKKKLTPKTLTERIAAVSLGPQLGFSQVVAAHDRLMEIPFRELASSGDLFILAKKLNRVAHALEEIGGKGLANGSYARKTDALVRILLEFPGSVVVEQDGNMLLLHYPRLGGLHLPAHAVPRTIMTGLINRSAQAAKT